jgi:N-acetylglutamate synthase-like GNAT family acetyltransferase
MVAVKGDELAGFGRIKPYPDFFELGSLGVMERFRNQGIGSALVSKLMKDFPAPEIWVTTDRQEFFARFGFKATKDGPLALKEKIERVCQRRQHPNAVIMLFHPTAPKP